MARAKHHFQLGFKAPSDMSPKAKIFASKKYPNLFRYPSRSKSWVFRKYSSEKGREFVRSTKETKNEAKAYRIGVELFNEWLGLEKDPAACETFRDFAHDYLMRKMALPDQEFSKNSKRTTKNAVSHLLKAFGHLRVDQITEDRWQDYWVSESRNKSQKFFNRRKTLIEIMRKAQRLGLITRLPTFDNPDPKTNAGQFLSQDAIERIFMHLTTEVRILAEFVYRTGFRPGEVLQYRWEMIDFEDGPTGSIKIPASITKTRRPREVPLNSAISAMLKGLERKSPWVFPSPRNQDKHMTSYKTSWQSACEKSGIRAQMYDLRHTFFTNAARTGLNIVMVAKYADTSVKMIESVYAKAEKSVLREIAG